MMEIDCPDCGGTGNVCHNCDGICYIGANRVCGSAGEYGDKDCPACKEGKIKVYTEAEINKLRLCGICKHASPTSMDHLRCYGRGTPYKPVGRVFSCDNFKLIGESE